MDCEYLGELQQCAARVGIADRVIFTAVNWEWKTREDWESRLEAVGMTVEMSSGVCVAKRT